uniref:Uncharacterized protein n=1 Tax=Streptomyces sp. F12 TaxID=1436084 RepID=V9Z7A4_9ACTN|nr:hypothetical protein pFRL6_325c [Streptomyces sp. F12]
MAIRAGLSAVAGSQERELFRIVGRLGLGSCSAQHGPARGAGPGLLQDVAGAWRVLGFLGEEDCQATHAVHGQAGAPVDPDGRDSAVEKLHGCDLAASDVVVELRPGRGRLDGDLLRGVLGLRVAVWKLRADQVVGAHRAPPAIVVRAGATTATSTDEEADRADLIVPAAASVSGAVACGYIPVRQVTRTAEVLAVSALGAEAVCAVVAGHAAAIRPRPTAAARGRPTREQCRCGRGARGAALRTPVHGKAGGNEMGGMVHPSSGCGRLGASANQTIDRAVQEVGGPVPVRGRLGRRGRQAVFRRRAGAARSTGAEGRYAGRTLRRRAERQGWERSVR